LLLNYHCFDIKKAVEFIGKKPKTIYEMKRRLGYLSNPNWTKKDIAILLKNGAKKASKILTNKTLNSCKIKLMRLHKKK
jgi:hypothetical protein